MILLTIYYNVFNISKDLFIKDTSLPSGVETQHQYPHLLVAEDLWEQLSHGNALASTAQLEKKDINIIAIIAKGILKHFFAIATKKRNKVLKV